IQIENDEDLDEAGVRILAGMEAEAVLITRGNDGLVLYERDLSPYRLPVSVSQPWEIVDPTGAGDTVAAVFALAISSGASMRQAAFLGNVAGGEVVRRLGAATLSPPELVAAVEQCALPAPEN
ncbi:MAG: PfkB family carbohydrate kinase, partial [Chloroflexota bacterium]